MFMQRNPFNVCFFLNQRSIEDSFQTIYFGFIRNSSSIFYFNGCVPTGLIYIHLNELRIHVEQWIENMAKQFCLENWLANFPYSFSMLVECPDSINKSTLRYVASYPIRS